MKAARHLLPFAAAALLGACSTVGGMPRGQQTADYKIEAAGGVQAEVGRSAANSSYRYGFGIRLKNAPRVASVKIERTRGGELGVVFDDSRHPTTATKAWQRHADGTRSYLYNNGDGTFDWIGQTAARKLTPQQAPRTNNTASPAEICREGRRCWCRIQLFRPSRNRLSCSYGEHLAAADSE